MASDDDVALGRAYRKGGAVTQELELWRRCVEADPDDAGANERLGWILWFTGRPDEALPWLHKAAALNPQGKWPYFYLGNAHLALGDYAESGRMYSHALELHASHSSAQAGVIWSLLAARKDDDAHVHLERFQSGEFDGDRYPHKLADIEYFLGEDDVALLRAREALAEPTERYWPRGYLASTILAALLWSDDRAAADEQLAPSERIDRERLAGGDEGFMPHVD